MSVRMSGWRRAPLYVLLSFPKLETSFVFKDPAPSFRDIAFNMAKPYVEGEFEYDFKTVGFDVDVFHFDTLRFIFLCFVLLFSS